MPLEVREVTESEVRGADEIWLTSSTKEVLAITTLDGKPVGDGKPGPLFRACIAGCTRSSSARVMRRQA